MFDESGNLNIGGQASAQDASNNLMNDVANLAPLATQFHGPTTGVSIGQIVNPTPNSAEGGALSQVGHFLGGVLNSIGHIGEAAGKWLVTNGVNAGTSVIHAGQQIAYERRDSGELVEVNALNKQFTAELTNLTNQYKSGQLSREQYSQGVKGLNQDMGNVVREDNALNNRININQTDGYKAAIDTASLLITLMGAGVGPGGTTAVLTRNGASVAVDSIEAQTAAQYLKSKAVSAITGGTESFMARAGADPELFAKLPEVAQTYIQRSIAEVAASGGQMSATDIARASAVNLALKYPVYYNFVSSTGTQIYDELDNKNYGDAVRTIAFNAALLLSGGPIGQAIHGAGRVAGAVTDATFDKTGFWDELGKFYSGGDGKTPNGGFAQAAKNIVSKDRDPAGRFWGEDDKKQFIQKLSDTAATNVHAEGGDEVAGAYRVAKGQKSMYNHDLSTVTPEDELKSMYNHSVAHEEMDAEGKRLGLTLTPGRADYRNLKSVADAIFTGPKEDWANNIEVAIGQNPGYAWANNDSFIKQIKQIAKDTPEDEAQKGAEAVKGIKAAFTVKGVPLEKLQRWANMGYVPISPKNIEAPFVKGSGVIESKFLDASSDTFTKMVQPLPVARSLGTLLTNMGLSPNASTQRVYQLFNAQLADNLRDLPETRSVLERAGDKSFTDDQKAADWLQKKLTSYAYKPTRGKIVSKMPITDLRIMTTADIQAATGATRGEAFAIQKAITRANLQIPMAVRGMGDRLVDRTFQLGPTGAVMRRYLRIQGSLRFSWNPFYQYLRVIPKTEYLTEASGGGIIKSVFSGRIGQVNKLRDDLRTGGFLEAKGSLGNVEGAEAVGATGVETAGNLGKKLLPAQEMSIAGLVDDQARRMGLSSKEYLATYPDQVKDTVQAIAQYDKHSNFLNSPLTRTLNLAFFPFRFEAKVAAATARGLARTSLLTQVSVIHGMMQAHTWLNSPEGEAWYSQNADAIGLFKYITPLANFNEVFESLLPGHDHSLGNFGELGGLPFGWIPAILDAEGKTNFNQVGVDPKSGQPFPTYIPSTTKGQAAIAVQDFLGAIFSYPGATVGLPSKTSITRTFGLGAVGGNKARDLKLTTPPVTSLSPQAQEYADTLQSLSNSKPGAPLQGGMAQPNTPTQEVSGLAVPTLPTSATTPPPRSIRSSTKKKKESEFTPALLPGQTTLGQL